MKSPPTDPLAELLAQPEPPALTFGIDEERIEFAIRVADEDTRRRLESVTQQILTIIAYRGVVDRQLLRELVLTRDELIALRYIAKQWKERADG